MASRKDLKEQRRREREEAERREARKDQRRRRVRVLGLATAAVAVAAAGVVFLVTAGGSDDPEEVFAAKQEGLQERVREAKLPLGAQHFHPTVRIVANGKEIPIPEDLGADPVGGHSPVHRHPGDPVLHAEGLQEGAFTLGQFMRVWGVPLTPRRLGPYRADGHRSVRVLVKPKGEKAYKESEQIDDLILRDGDEVYVLYGTPDQSPVVL